jgi:hypothetical protein
MQQVHTAVQAACEKQCLPICLHLVDGCLSCGAVDVPTASIEIPSSWLPGVTGYRAVQCRSRMLGVDRGEGTTAALVTCGCNSHWQGFSADITLHRQLGFVKAVAEGRGFGLAGEVAITLGFCLIVVASTPSSVAWSEQSIEWIGHSRHALRATWDSTGRKEVKFLSRPGSAPNPFSRHSNCNFVRPEHIDTVPQPGCAGQWAKASALRNQHSSVRIPPQSLVISQNHRCPKGAMLAGMPAVTMSIESHRAPPGKQRGERWFRRLHVQQDLVQPITSCCKCSCPAPDQYRSSSQPAVSVCAVGRNKQHAVLTYKSPCHDSMLQVQGLFSLEPLLPQAQE